MISDDSLIRIKTIFQRGLGLDYDTLGVEWSPNQVRVRSLIADPTLVHVEVHYPDAPTESYEVRRIYPEGTSDD